MAEYGSYIRIEDGSDNADALEVIVRQVLGVICTLIGKGERRIKALEFNIGGAKIEWRLRTEDGKPGVEHDPVNHPSHYCDGGIETIDFIEAKKLPYHLGNAVKYISRAGKKNDAIEDLKKARWYLDRYIRLLEQK